MTTFRFMAFGPTDLANLANMPESEYDEFLRSLSDDALRHLVDDLATYRQYRAAVFAEAARRAAA